MISAYSVDCSGPFVRPFASISPNIVMIDSGVFSSCDTFEMNSLFSSFARRSRRIASGMKPKPTRITVIAAADEQRVDEPLALELLALRCCPSRRRARTSDRPSR